MKHLSKIFYAIIIVLFMSCVPEHKKEGDKSLFVSENGRYLTLPDGRPFFYLGDTAWELFLKLNREEATIYLENRAEKGFTVIQATAMGVHDGLRTPNSYGEVPLHDLDPTKPNEKYFEHVDFIVNKAEELGLFIGMLPTFGDKVTDEHFGWGPVVFNPKNAAIYGEFLGKRYKNKPIIWILGGDWLVTNDTVFQIWEAMATGIKRGDDGRHLISYHPRGNTSSSFWFHNESWFDLNMYQSCHGRRFNDVYRHAQHDYLLNPVKPFIDGEPAYEDIPVSFWKYYNRRDLMHVLLASESVLDTNGLIKDKAHFEEGYFTDYDVRVHAYWNILSGACGYTYGNNAVWQMYKKKGIIDIPCLFEWKESLDRPGAEDMKHFRALFESRSFAKLIPDQSVIYGINKEGEDHIRAAIANDHSFLIVYLAKGQKVTIVTKKINDDAIQGWWFNPRDGEAIKITDTIVKGRQSFSPPSSGLDKDWVLVLDSRTAGYLKPGIF